MNKDYWLNLSTGKTRRGFSKVGAMVSDFRQRQRKQAMRIKPRDYLLHHLIGVSRFPGVAEVKSDFYDGTAMISEDMDFSVDGHPLTVPVNLNARACLLNASMDVRPVDGKRSEGVGCDMICCGMREDRHGKKENEEEAFR